MLHAGKEPLKPWCVFIIDDSPEDRAEVRRMLLHGCERRLTFVEAEMAESAIGQVLGMQPPPDCIVLDYYLPDMQAPEVLTALKGPDGMPVCPVVVLTGGVSGEDGRRVLRAGAQDYIGKAWTSPEALCRAIENASESWSMARELRQRKEALRLVTDREVFRTVFGEATRDLADEHALKRVASQLLGLHLGANRLVYVEVLDDKRVVIEPGYVSGVQQMDGVYRLADYGAAFMATFQAGESMAVTDMRHDRRHSAAEKLVYARLEIVSYLAVPILKGSRLVAVLGVHQKTPRVWTSDEKTIAREIAERTWTAVEQARSEAKLLANRVQLAQVVAIMPSFSAILRGSDHVLEMANQAFYDLVRRGPEILGLTYVKALAELAGQAFLAQLDAVYCTGEKFEAKGMQAMVQCGSGKGLAEIFIDVVFLPLKEADGQTSGIFLHGVDRTAEVRATGALAQRERELRSVTENTPDLLTRFDSQFRHVFANSVVEKHLGLTARQVLGKTHRQLDMPVELSCQWEKAIRYVFDHGACSALEFSLDTPRHGLRHFACRLVPEFNEQGQVEFALGVTHDITEGRNYEQQLLEQDVRKDEFLATLAHELRNPLAPIRTGLQLFKLSPKADVAARTLEVMERQLGQLVRLIDDLMDVSRISSGKIVLRRERITFQEVAAAALETSRPLIEAAGHSLIIDWPEAPVWLDADPTRLAQVFGNLLTNSAKYMLAGGQIRFSALLQGESVVISVQDTGMGIPADMIGSVFDMFTQINRTLDRAQGGLGIGLSLVKTLVGMHGGTVEVASAGIDLGSSFTVILPGAPAVVAQPQAGMAGPAAVQAPFASHRILVVDDNVDAAQTMVMFLGMSGHCARAAFGGQEALDVAMAFQPEVVFLDIGMPVMNGYEVARRLLATPSTASAKLIALTGWGAETDIQKSKMSGFHAHLIKPVDPEALEALLAAFLPASTCA